VQIGSGVTKMNETDVKIGEVQTELVVTESVGSLSAEDVKRIVDIAMQQMRHEQDRLSQRQKDTSVFDSNYEAHS
jgi:polyhydroxyalkanoate synthesis regulator phasin